VKKLAKEMEGKEKSKMTHPSFTDTHRNSSAMNSSLQQSQINRSMQEMDLLDPENSTAMNAKHIRTVTADVEILKKDLLKISSLHIDNSRDISDIRSDLENEVKQVTNHVF
jgi:hypothetical protein